MCRCTREEREKKQHVLHYADTASLAEKEKGDGEMLNKNGKQHKFGLPLTWHAVKDDT
jgi:hypothetical protein